MKKELTIKVGTKKTDTAAVKTDLLAIGVFEGSLKNNAAASTVDKKLNGSISKIYKLGDFKGKPLTTALIYSNGQIGAARVLLIGLGDKKKFNANTLRKAASLAGKVAVDNKCKSLALALHQQVEKKSLDLVSFGQAMAEGAYFGAYRYDEFISSKENSRPTNLDVNIIDSSTANATKISKGAKVGSTIGSAQNIARTFSNRPPNVMYPVQLAAEAKKIAAKTPGLSCTIFDEKQLKQKGMGGIIAVGQGSQRKPRMIILKYSPKNAKNIKAAPIALVGKAITFDSGGISLKPSAGMDAMKMDMTGGASVIATMKAIAMLKLPVKVIGVICAAENKPSGTSFQPGDIITTLSGKTIEVLNTDAEGRLVLCDGIHYAKTQKCKTIIDICTLTGACVVALGEHKAGLMGNNDKLIEAMKAASEQCGEPVWHLPCGDEYAEEMKSKIADLKNIGSSRWGGASRAASFLAEFADDTAWAHLDIAPMSEAAGPMKKITVDGSIGFGVRIMTAYVMNVC